MVEVDEIVDPAELVLEKTEEEEEEEAEEEG